MMSVPFVVISSILVATTASCAAGPEEVQLGTVTQEARASNRAPGSLAGFWRTKTFAEGAWVDLIWVVGRHHAWHVVSAYADEELSIPLVRWDAVRRYDLGVSTASTFELEWEDLYGRLYAHVDNPGLFAGIGIDDCALEVGVSRNLSGDNCGAPLFPFRDCVLMDFVRVEGDQMTFGDPGEGDRCVQRPTRDEAWTFERVPFTPELGRALFGTSWRL